jgi:predicted Ser/Thr protein kinase
LPEDSNASTCARCVIEACFAGASVHGSPEAAEPFDSALGAPGEVFGDYELLEEIARGGMGVVFKARQRSLDRIVAVKMMLPGWLSSRESVQRFRMEAEAASRLRHPGIVSIHDVGECEGQHFYSMDYIDGQDLVRRVEGKQTPAELAARWMQSVAEAIHHAHQHGILHRDLKPANVIIDSQDAPHVTDFGLAKLLDEERHLTVTGRVLGTPSFMPPEQADARHGTVTVASDVYGLGAILYFLLTGKAPFEGSSMEQTLHLLLTQDPVPPSHCGARIPRDLETICLKCLSKEPHRRYASAAELAEDLTAWQRHEPIRARPVPLIERLWYLARRNPGFAGVSFLLAASILAGAIFQQRALNQARRARAAAEGLVQYMNEDLTEQLRPLGRLRLLDNVNSTVQRYYQGIPMKENLSDPRVGEAQFYRNNATVLRESGRFHDAKQSALSAVALLQPLSQQQPANPQVAATLAEAHAEVRNILAVLDPDAALEHAHQTVQFCTRASELNAGNREALGRLANARLELASAFLQLGKEGDAGREIQTAASLLASLPENEALSPDRQFQRALCSYYQGLADASQGQTNQAQSNFGDYLECLTRLAQQDPADAQAQFNLAVAQGQLGQALFNLNDPTQALQHLREYHRIAQELERRDPGNVNYQRELAFSLQWLAETSIQNQGAPDEITKLLTDAYDSFRKLANEFPEGEIWQQNVARSLPRLADWLDLQGNREQARQLLYDELSQRWNALLKSSVRRSPHVRFIWALDWVENKGGPPGAEKNGQLTRLEDWWTKVSAEASKTNAGDEWSWVQAALRNRIARALSEQGKLVQAKHELELALPLWRRFIDRNQDDADSAIGLTQALLGISAATLQTTGAAEAAKTLPPFTEWLRSRRSVRAGAEDIRKLVAGWRDDLEKLPQATSSGELRAALKDFGEAITQLPFVGAAGS